MDQLRANKVQTSQEQAQRRNPVYRTIARKIDGIRQQLRASPTRPVRSALLDQLEKLEQERSHIPYFAARHPTKLGYVRYADDFVILVNGEKTEAIDYKNTVEGYLTRLGLTLSEEKTTITHWAEPITFLGYHIHGHLRYRGVQITAILSIPKAKERLIRRELLQLASYHHIPELDAMLAMNATFRGWCNYYRYANAPSEVFERVARKMWWFFAHFLARRQRKSIRQLLAWAHQAGRYKTVRQGQDARLTFTMPVGKKEQYLAVFPAKSAEIRAVPTNATWTVDLKPVTPHTWMQGRSAATRLTALTRSDGVCERCGDNLAQHIHHPNRMKAKRTMLAKVASDHDQRQQAKALCKECHLEEHHGYWQG